MVPGFFLQCSCENVKCLRISCLINLLFSNTLITYFSTMDLSTFWHGRKSKVYLFFSMFVEPIHWFHIVDIHLKIKTQTVWNHFIRHTTNSFTLCAIFVSRIFFYRCRRISTKGFWCCFTTFHIYLAGSSVIRMDNWILLKILLNLIMNR